MKINYLFISHQGNHRTQSTKKKKTECSFFVSSSWYRPILYTFPCMWKFDVDLIVSVAWAHVWSPTSPFHLTALLMPFVTLSLSFFSTFLSRVPLSFHFTLAYADSTFHTFFVLQMSYLHLSIVFFFCSWTKHVSCHGYVIVSHRDKDGKRDTSFSECHVVY